MERNEYTLAEVKQELSASKGDRISFTHPLFAKGEYIYRDEYGRLRCEGDGFLIEEEFWQLRDKSPEFQHGWKRYDLYGSDELN